MRLQLSTFSEEHKNILKMHRKLVLNSLNLIADYLVSNQEVSDNWKAQINEEHRINYYEVIPKASRLQTKEIELEILVTNSNGVITTTVFRKNITNANNALISIVREKLLERINKLTIMKETASEEQKGLIDQHLDYTLSLVEECYFLKINSQLLICEIGALNYLHKINNKLNELIKDDNEKTFLLKKHIDELEEIIKAQLPIKKDNINIVPFARYEVEMLKRQFNLHFNKTQSLCMKWCDQHPVDYSIKEYIHTCFSNMQYLFFAKNDVKFSISK